jgi:hypothetical protein
MNLYRRSGGLIVYGRSIAAPKLARTKGPISKPLSRSSLLTDAN